MPYRDPERRRQYHREYMRKYQRTHFNPLYLYLHTWGKREHYRAYGKTLYRKRREIMLPRKNRQSFACYWGPLLGLKLKLEVLRKELAHG